jgi:hypothetical protein
LSAPLYRKTCIDFEPYSREESSPEGTMIKKVSGGYKVLSEDGKKNLGGPYKSKAEAQKRLRQVEFFKHKKG